MRTDRLLFAVTAFVFLADGHVSYTRSEDQKSALVITGEKIAANNCKRCHAIDQTSKSTHASAPAFRNIVKRYSPWTLAEALAEGIVVGHSDMPEFKFEPPDITALLTFMDSLDEDANDDQKNQ